MDLAKHLRIEALARPGDVVFLRYDSTIGRQQKEWLLENVEPLTKMAGVKIVLLDQHLKVQSVERSLPETNTDVAQPADQGSTDDAHQHVVPMGSQPNHGGIERPA